MIEQFESIYQNNIIPRYTGFLENIEKSITTSNGIAQLTILQEKALNSDKFWYRPEGETKNLIIQGATSSGKTMLAELLAMQCIANNKKTIYLVPLRALIEEKRKKFDNDMKTEDDWRKVYGSSSDYQDHDMQLMEGDYDLAVIVYEKFFALLAEPSDLLKDCSLIVVDEMQLLSAPDRGPKLEYAITKVRKQYSYSSQIRILGLTTADSQTKYVERWLDADVIRELARPVRLRERIISLDGTYWERIVPGNNDSPLEEGGAGTTSNPIKGHLEGVSIQDTSRKDYLKKKKEFLCALLKKIYSNNPKKKTIIFASSRRRAADLAREICENRVLGTQTTEASEQLINEISKIDFYDEKDAQKWKNLLLPRGVAYHNAALAMNMREMIEEEFRKENGAIRLIVATETLMIGVNLPADIIILFDDSVPRRSDDTSGINFEPLNTQEYRNFIGRCGRLGITDVGGGESYLLARDVRDLRGKWTNYVNEKQETIQSALTNADAMSFTPYFLNLLCRGNNAKFRMKDIVELLYATLSYHGNNKSDEVQEIAKDIVDILKRRKLAIESESDPMDFNLDGDQGEDIQYATNEFGKTMAPYALSVKTCWEIYLSFFLDGFAGKYAGLPLSYTGKNLLPGTSKEPDNGFLLDILYRICSMSEVSDKIKYPGLPEKTARNGHNQDIFSHLRQTVKDFLRKYKAEEESSGRRPFWPDSRLEAICNDTEDNITNEEIETALRAILLKDWLEKKLMKEIRSEINLSSDRYSLDAGDFDRLGEVCAYIIEAVANCFHASGKRFEALRDDKGHGLKYLKYSFLNLASAIKYGMDDPDLLTIAKMNIPGLGRKAVIELGKKAKLEGYESTSLFITSRGKTLEGYLTKEQLKRLREFRTDLNYKQEIESLYEDRKLPEETYDALIHLTNQGAKADWEESIDKLIPSILTGTLSLINCFGTKVGRTIHHEDSVLSIAYLYIDKEKESLQIAHINDLLETLSEKERGKVVIIINVDAVDELLLEGNAAETNWGILTSTQLCMYMIELARQSSLVRSDSKTTSANSYALFHVLAESNHQALFKGKTAISETIRRLIESVDYRNDSSKHSQQFGNYVRDIGSGANGRVCLYQKKQPGYEEEFACKIILVPNDNCQQEIAKSREELNHYFSERNINSIEDESINKATKDFYKSKSHFDQEYIKAIPEAIENLKAIIPKEHDSDFSLGISCYVQGITYFKEAKIIEGLSAAPNVIRIKGVNEEFFWDGGNPQCKISIWMDCMDGNLSALSPIPADETIRIGLSMCNALAYCHAKGILHRDIKPQNILFKENNDNPREYYISDFGSASRKGTKTIIGTPGFIPPEVIAGKGWSKQGDIFSLGATLKKVCVKKGCDSELRHIWDKACNPDITERYQNMDEFKHALEQLATASRT